MGQAFQGWAGQVPGRKSVLGPDHELANRCVQRAGAVNSGPTHGGPAKGRAGVLGIKCGLALGEVKSVLLKINGQWTATRPRGRETREA
jgi:hypothetical protein